MSSAEHSSTPVASTSQMSQNVFDSSVVLEHIVGEDGGTRSPMGRQQATPRASSSPMRGILLPPFGMHNLPTPQSPGDFAAYQPGLSSQSPMPNGMLRGRTAMLQSMSHETHEMNASPSTAFITPESSPESRRRGTASQQEPAPNTGASSFPSPRTPVLDVHEARSEAPGSATAHSRRRSPIPEQRDNTPSSGLSSPFMERLSLSSHKNNPQTHAVDELPHATTLFSTPPPLSAPIPQRPLGGEMQRIRLQMAVDKAAQRDEREARRPDWLVRQKRLVPDDDLSGDILDPDEAEHTTQGLGVTVTPMKGRRIQLFQETSEESFEQSLLAGGYPGYGITPSYEPQTPDHKGKNGLSQRAMHWLQQVTPARPGASASSSEPEQDWVPSEKEIRKRKRLAAFEEHDEAEAGNKLYVVEMEGKGRVLVNQLPEETPETIESPSKKRGGRRRRRGGARRKVVLGSVGDDGEEKQPDWPDNAFPWSLRAQERQETARLEQDERLKIVERYFDDGDTEEEEEDEDQSLGLTVNDDEPEPILKVPRPGRGKMVPISMKVNPNDFGNPHDGGQFVYVPSDPADARAALLSRRSVRTFIHRRKMEDPTDICICSGQEEDSELVECDDCKKWYHLHCIGLSDVSELGPEEEPWYCAKCLGLGDMASSDPVSEPTFVPTDDTPSKRWHDPPFYQGALQDSPGPSWGAFRPPSTPTRGGNYSQFSTRSSWDNSSRVGPTTPLSNGHNPRVYVTPGSFENLFSVESPFDPTRTPSLGTKGSFTTPRSTLFKTPLRSAGNISARDLFRQTGSMPFGGFDESPFRSIYTYDDTPVTRSQPRNQTRTLTGRKLYDSPVPSRSAAPLLRESLLDDTASPGAFKTRSQAAAEASQEDVTMRTAVEAGEAA